MNKPSDPRKFFMVWSPQGDPPAVRHSSFGAARAVATKLSTKHPEREFFVLESCWGPMAKPGVDGDRPAAEVPAADMTGQGSE